MPRVHSLDTLWVENFDEIALSHTVKEIEVNCVLPFLAKIQNVRHFWGGEIFLKIAKSTLFRYTGVENFEEIVLSRTVKEIEANLCFSIFLQKFENTKWPPFLGRESFLKTAKTTLLRYPVGRKF